MKVEEGFKGQRSVILPQFIVDELQNDPLVKALYLTDIGYYPKADQHYRVRREGCNQYILIYCVDGKGWFSVDGQRSEVQANQFLIIPKGVPHAYGSNEKEPWSIYWIHFSGELAVYFADQAEHPKSIVPSKISRIQERLQLFDELFQNLEMGYSLENLRYVNICLMHFLASFKYINQFRQIRLKPEPNVVDEVILFMRENLSKKLILTQIAAHCGLSASRLSWLFRQKTGRSPIDYLLHLRIQRACQWLDTSDLRVKEIAHRVGFEDAYYFSRVFKQIMTVSPVQYRKWPKG
jgi:AraC-like DNA-binding protein